MFRKFAKLIWGLFANIEWLWKSTGFRRFLWSAIAQKGELKFHKQDQRASDEALMREAGLVYARYGYGPDDFNGKVIIDIGAGSHLMTRYFKGSHIIALDPLADKYLAEVKWCKLKEAKEVYSVPAEELVQKAVGRVDFALCSNVLDHCFDPQAVVNNMYAYVKPGGTACIATDCHDHRDPMHQLLLNEETVTQMVLKAGFKIEKLIKGLGPIYEGGRQDFGHGNTLIFRMIKEPAKGA